MQDAFAKLTESFQKKIKEQANAQEDALLSLKEQLSLVGAHAAAGKEPLSNAIGDAGHYKSDLPLSSGRSHGILAQMQMKEDFGSIERQKLSTVQFGQMMEGDQGLSQRSDRERH